MRRRAERRAERVTAGTVELERRLADLLRGGLASAERSGDGLWEETAARMVDAQAPGLAARVRELAVLPGTAADRPVRLLEECALLHLLGRGWQHRERLPEGLAATVRSRVGLTARADGPAIRDHWLVLAQYDTADSRLTTRRIWLYGAGTGRTALLLSYGAAGRAPELALPVGLALDAELSAYPGTGQSRAALGERFARPAPTDVRPPGTTTSGAAARYGEALRDDPGWTRSRSPSTGSYRRRTATAGSWPTPTRTPPCRSPRPLGPAPVCGVWSPCRGRPGQGVRRVRPPGIHSLAAWPEGAGEVVPLC
ncbi:hypothetical protein SHKM778_10430 [Streptomyces sp. KM77-8]|uniref:SWIM zinc finger family protein n=1 Tax=Streptomyces haneummycinicus TaxID=3074435 RepID=A0AAT9HB69_9ACTN